jgi:hypothetical protein
MPLSSFTTKMALWITPTSSVPTRVMDSRTTLACSVANFESEIYRFIDTVR